MLQKIKFIPDIFKTGYFASGWIPPHPTFFVRREVYEKFGTFDLNFKFAADVELMMRLLELHKISVTYIQKPIVMMRLGGITNSSFINILLQNIEIIRCFKKHDLKVNVTLFLIKKIFDRCNQYIKAKKLKQIKSKILN